MKVDHPMLSLCATLWLLVRWGGWEDEEKSLMRLLEDGCRRLNEEGRGWLYAQLADIVQHSSDDSPSSSSTPSYFEPAFPTVPGRVH